MSISYKDATRDDRMQAVIDALGTTASLEIFTGPPPGKSGGAFNADSGTPLARLPMANPVGSTTGGVLTFGSITSATALAGGTPGYARMKTAASGAASTVIVELDAGVGSGSLSFNSTLTSGATVSVTSATLTEGNA